MSHKLEINTTLNTHADWKKKSFQTIWTILLYADIAREASTDNWMVKFTDPPVGCWMSLKLCPAFYYLICPPTTCQLTKEKNWVLKLISYFHLKMWRFGILFEKRTEWPNREERSPWLNLYSGTPSDWRWTGQETSSDRSLRSQNNKSISIYLLTIWITYSKPGWHPRQYFLVDAESQ